jgi:hypothetical protein
MSNKLVAGGFSQGQVDRWRQKIQVGMAIDTLNKVVSGDLQCDTARMKGVEIALRKTVPDLTSVDITTGGQSINFTWTAPNKQTIIDMTTKGTQGIQDIQDSDTQGTQPDTQGNVSDTGDEQSGGDGANEAHTSTPEKQDDPDSGG